ncbi:MAG: preprotein translocase subunit YajC [Janthinobacterium lividum]
MFGGNGQLFFIVIMIALLFFMFSRTRKQQRAQQQMQSAVEPGAEVVTISGTYGTVVAMEGDVVTLEIAPGVQTRWTRRAVARVVPPAVPPVVTDLTVTAGHGEETPANGAHAAGLDLTKTERLGDDAGGVARP